KVVLAFTSFFFLCISSIVIVTVLLDCSSSFLLEVDGSGSNPSGRFGKPRGGRETRGGGDGLEGSGGQLSMEIVEEGFSYYPVDKGLERSCGGWERFNTIITSLKALDETFSSRNHVRKLLRALPTKWHPKVTTIKESKDLSTLPLDELIGNLKVYEVVLEKDSEISKGKKEKYKSLALTARKDLSDGEVSCSFSDDEEYSMVVETPLYQTQNDQKNLNFYKNVRP
nr:UBN2 domain-containing protein [Tanacetum cinerariifolium]